MLDAPPTGRIAQFLNVNAEVAGLAKVGPIKNHADLVMSVIGSPRTAVHLVTLLEEMPVQETIDAIDELRANALPVGGLIVNMVRPTLLPDADLARAYDHDLPVDSVAQSLTALGLDATLAPTLLDEAADRAQRVQLQRAERQRLTALGLSMANLPFMAEGIDLTSLYALASALREAGWR